MLSTPQAVLTLGALVVRELQQHGRITLFINAAGLVEICPMGELELDGLPEDSAIQMLVAKGYTDSELVTYLKAREARARPHEGEPIVEDL